MKSFESAAIATVKNFEMSISNSGVQYFGFLGKINLPKQIM